MWGELGPAGKTGWIGTDDGRNSSKALLFIDMFMALITIVSDGLTNQQLLRKADLVVRA